MYPKSYFMWCVWKWWCLLWALFCCFGSLLYTYIWEQCLPFPSRQNTPEMVWTGGWLKSNIRQEFVAFTNKLCKQSSGMSYAENLSSKATDPHFTSTAVNAGNTSVMAYFFFSVTGTPELQKIPVNIGSETTTQISALKESLLVLVATKPFKWPKKHWSFRGPYAILSCRFACDRSALTQQTSFFWVAARLPGTASINMMWFPTLPIPYSCVMNPIWCPKSTVAPEF